MTRKHPEIFNWCHAVSIKPPAPLQGTLQSISAHGIAFTSVLWTILDNEMKCMKLNLLFSILLVSSAAHAALIVKVDAPKQVGKKTVVKLTMKNTFKEKVESARAQVFLTDDKGKVMGTASRWVIGGTKDKPALAPDAEATFNFVVETDQPFSGTKVTFNRVILEGEKLADPVTDVQIHK